LEVAQPLTKATIIRNNIAIFIFSSSFRFVPLTIELSRRETAQRLSGRLERLVGQIQISTLLLSEPLALREVIGQQ